MIEDTLVRRGIAYQIVGGTKFYERAEIKDAIAYLTVLANPQDVDLVRADRQHAQARDRPDVAVARAGARRDHGQDGLGRGAPTRPRCPGWAPRRSAPSRASWPRWGLRERAGAAGPVGDLLEARAHETGYLDALEAERTIEAQGRIENLAELVNVAREYDAAQPRTAP